MNELNIVLISIISLFFILLIIKHLTKSQKICAICSATALTWISLLILNFLGYFQNKMIITLLMGMTLLGIYYIVEKSVRKELLFFRLPFLLTLISVFYSLISEISNLIAGLKILAPLWLIFALIYLYRTNEKINIFTSDVIKCCRDW